MYVPEVKHSHKVMPVWIGSVFYHAGGTLAVLKENRHAVGNMCGHFENEVPKLPW